MFVIFGAHTIYAWEVIESARRAGHRDLLVLDYNEGSDADLGAVAVQNVRVDWRSFPTILGAGLPEYREPAFGAAVENGVVNWAALIDPTSVVAASAEVEHGVYVNSQSAVGAKCTLHAHSHVNRSASVGHHSTLESFSCVGPGATLSNSVTLEHAAFVGAGAVVIPGVRIGARAVVGAGAVVTADVAPDQVVVGNPARPRKVSN